jgi:hypothetical protein
MTNSTLIPTLAGIKTLWKGNRHDGNLHLFTSTSPNIPAGVVLCHFIAVDIEFTCGIDTAGMQDTPQPLEDTILENFDSY